MSKIPKNFKTEIRCDGSATYYYGKEVEIPGYLSYMDETLYERVAWLEQNRVFEFAALQRINRSYILKFQVMAAA